MQPVSPLPIPARRALRKLGQDIRDARRRRRIPMELLAERARISRSSLEPALSLGKGQFYTRRSLFGSLGDSAPDRWGRTLMKRAEARRAEAAKEKARTLYEVDYLLLVNDETRQGALRFNDEPGSA